MRRSKRCGRCEKVKPIAQFTSQRGRYCSPCRKGTRKRRTLVSHEERQIETYGYRPGEWQKLHESQDGRCAICLGERPYNLDSDHCHTTGLLRGQLCKLCNRRLLPGARNDIAILKRAIEYLRNPPAQRVLGRRVHIDKRQEE